MSFRTIHANIPRGAPTRFDAYLEWLDATTLNQMARPVLGPETPKLKKPDCLRELLSALRDPRAYDAMAGQLDDWSRCGLSLIRRYGGSLPVYELGGALWMCAHPDRKRADPAQGFVGALLTFQSRGLVLFANPVFHPSANTSPVARSVAFADARLLAAARPCAPPPLPVTPVSVKRETLRATAMRGPAEVALRISTLVEAIEREGGLALTQQGRPNRSAVNRLGKALTGAKTTIPRPAEPLNDESGLLTGLLVAAGLLQQGPNQASLAISQTTRDHLNESYEQQTRRWAWSYQTLTGWAEAQPGGAREPIQLNRPGTLNALRAALLVALAALPDPTAWYPFPEFAAAMQNALCGVVSLRPNLETYDSTFVYMARRERLARFQRQEQLYQASWSSWELPWLEAAFRGVLYHLGLVEVAIPATSPDTLLFRLTDLGRTAIWDVWRANAGPAEGDAHARAATAAGGAVPGNYWVVQPNLDVVVTLNGLPSDRLAFIGRIAARQSAAQHVATFRLTRQSIYHALESGLAFSTILDDLTAGAGQPLAPTVVRTLHDWAGYRERLQVRQAVTLLEFPNSAERDETAAQLRSAAAPLGECFLRLQGPAVPEEIRPRIQRELHYGFSSAPCLTVSEDGVLTELRLPNLEIRAHLGHWAEPSATHPGEWRLTPESIRAGVRSRGNSDDLWHILLPQAQDKETPPLLVIALGAWTASTPNTNVSLATVTVLHVTDPGTLDAVRRSPLLAPFLAHEIGSGTFLIPTERVAEMEALLRRFGIEPQRSLPPPKPKRVETYQSPDIGLGDFPSNRHGRRRW